MKILRDYISLVIEAAITPEQAQEQGFALFKNSNSIYVNFILYNAYSAVKNIAIKSSDDKPRIQSDSPIDIVAMIRVLRPKKDCWGAAMVQYSAAEKGYGPMMYDIALSEFGVLMCDRRGVSASARNIWDYYSQNRRDITSREFDDRRNPRTLPKEDDCDLVPSRYDDDITNYAYFTKGNTIDTNQMETTHQRVLEKYEQLGIDAGDVELFINKKSFDFFHKKYD